MFKQKSLMFCANYDRVCRLEPNISVSSRALGRIWNVSLPTIQVFMRRMAQVLFRDILIK